METAMLVAGGAAKARFIGAGSFLWNGTKVTSHHKKTSCVRESQCLSRISRGCKAGSCLRKLVEASGKAGRLDDSAP